MSDKQVDESRLRALRFDDDLEAKLKPFDPKDYACAASTQMNEALDGRARVAIWRPHDSIHSIEASCAFRRRHSRAQVSRNDLAKVMNVYSKHPDQYVMHLLEKEQNLELAFRVMALQQFPFQYRPHYQDFGRVYAIFVKDDPLARTADLLTSRFGVTPFSWLAVAFAVGALVIDRRPPIFKLAQITNFEEWELDAQEILACIELSSRSVEVIGEQFHQDREELEKPFLRGLIQSGFLQRPIIRFDSELYLAPLPALMFRQAGEGLIRFCRQFDPVFGEEIGKSFEQYVDVVIRTTRAASAVFGADEVAEHSPGRSCDFVVETPDCVVLIECKAVSLAARILTEKSLRQDGSTTQIVEGIDQVVSTAEAIQSGRLSRLIQDDGRPILPIVLTYGEIPMVNAQWYRDRIIRPGLDQKGLTEDRISKLFCQGPQVLSIEAFEMFVLVLEAKGMTFNELVDLKKKANYMEVGEWNTFLSNIVSGESIGPLGPPHEAMNEFFNRVVGSERVKKWQEGSE